MFHCNVKMSGIKKHTPSNNIVVTKWLLLGITVQGPLVGIIRAE